VEVWTKAETDFAWARQRDDFGQGFFRLAGRLLGR
jgi:hypothetical protein